MTNVVLGPAPCSTCGAWVEWLGVGPWVSIESHEPHECEVYLRGQADTWFQEMAAYPQRWVTYAEEPILTWRLVVALLLVAAFFGLVLARHQAGLL